MAGVKDFLIQDYRNVDKYLNKLSRSGLANFSPLIVTCALTGGNHGKEANPNLPETPEEQAQQAYDAYNAGASMVHVHRRSSANPAVMTADPEEYTEVNRMIRAKCPDIIINNTAGGGKMRMPNGAISPAFTVSISAKPEVCSIDISNFVAAGVLKKRQPPLTGRDEDQPVEFAYGLLPSEAAAALQMMKENGCKPEFECFDIGDLQYLKSFIRAGLVDDPYLVQMVFGEATNYPTIDYMQTAMNCMPDNSIFGTIAVGATQFPLLAAAIVLGGNVRVGMEDNVYISKGELATGNGQLVEKIVRIAKELGRPIATPEQAREMLGLGAPRQY